MSSSEAPLFAPMTRPTYGPLLAGAVPSGEALGLWQEETPAGLALAQVMAPGEAQLLSIFVHPQLWRHGLGAQLLGVMESALAGHHGAKRLYATYSSEAPSVAAFEGLLRKQAWSAPFSTVEGVRFRHARALNHSTFQRVRLPSELKVFLWRDLTPAQRATVEQGRAEVPPQYWPFNADEYPLDLASSLGAEVDGEVVGWVLNHQAGPDSLRYTTMYMRPRWQTALNTFGLAVESMHRAYKAYGPELIGIFAVLADNAPMLRILHRHFVPHAEFRYEIRRAEKLLVSL